MQHRILFGYTLLVLELIGLLVWFGIATWYQLDGSLDPAYRLNQRNFLFHHASVGSVIVYILRHHHSDKRPLGWLPCIPFTFALLADTDNLLFAVVNLTRVNYGAWVAFVTLASAVLCATLCAGVWILTIKYTRFY